MTTTILPTIEATNSGLAVTSETIARGSGVQHKNVLELIDNRRAEFEQFGPTAFETRSQKRGGNPIRTAVLNEPQSTLLMTFMRNTEQVVAFKVALVKAFYQMAQQLKNGTQDALFTDDALGLSIGQPVPHLPKALTAVKTDPRTTRNDRIAQAAREANGQWVPVTVADFGDKQYTELAKGINYGNRKSFADGNYRAVTRDNQLYIRHNTGKAA
ncbi:MAG: Rha family transcriptional regulator [Micrococcaceae bacterium]|nr:Rha family transcriptional regulator [Micrococcaceae bacterium]